MQERPLRASSNISCLLASDPLKDRYNTFRSLMFHFFVKIFMGAVIYDSSVICCKAAVDKKKAILDGRISACAEKRLQALKEAEAAPLELLESQNAESIEAIYDNLFPYNPYTLQWRGKKIPLSHACRLADSYEKTAEKVLRFSIIYRVFSMIA